jgi:hypothetical protein
MQRRLVLILALLCACVLPAAAHEPASALDPARDPRLARRVRLRAEGMPFSRVLAAVAAETGVRLEVAGRVGDERLVAFVPDAPLAEVLGSIADLYRCTWTRAGNTYRLEKPAKWVREEQRLREDALKQVLARFADHLRDPAAAPVGHPRDQPELWRALYRELFPILESGSDELLREGYLYRRVGAIPGERRAAILERLTPLLRAQEESLRENIRQLREMELQMGVPPEFAVREKPPTVPEKCTLTVDLRLSREIRIEVGMRRDSGDTWYNWFSASGDDLHEQGLALYEDRPLRLPKTAGGPAAETTDAADPLERVVEVSVPQKAVKQDWIGVLGRLSDAARVPIYADCYPNLLDMGVSQHPRGAVPAGGKGSVTQILDAVCFPAGQPGLWRDQANSFWWRRGNSALVRSRRWLWESAQVIPAGLLDRLARSEAKMDRRSPPGARILDPEDLRAIAGLDFLQLQGLGRLSQHLDFWHYGVRVPSRLSPPARQLLVTEGITWEKLALPDRQALVRMVPELAADPNPAYKARIWADARQAPAQGGMVLNLQFVAPGSPGAYPAQFILPGLGLDREPLTVSVLPNRPGEASPPAPPAKGR